MMDEVQKRRQTTNEHKNVLHATLQMWTFLNVI